MNRSDLLRATALIATLITTACSDMSGPDQPGADRSSSKSFQGRSLQLTKECSEYLGLAGDHCTIIKSNVRQIPAGSTVTYLADADLVNLSFDGDVVLRANPSDAAFGHCIITDLLTATGTCEFTSGIGQLSGFRARVVVSADRDPLLTDWKGTYSLSPRD
jgi:hypothetical protein